MLRTAAQLSAHLTQQKIRYIVNIMKKQLLGSTMIVAVALLVAAPVVAAEKPVLSFAGYARAEISFVSQDLDAGRERGYHIETDDTHLSWTAKGTSDDGLSYSATAKIDFDSLGSPKLNEAYVALGGEWGRVVMGDDDGADDIMMKGGYSLLTGGFGYDGGASSSINYSTKGSGAQGFASLVGDTGDATKVSYFTPLWNGLQLGASWTPDADHNYNAGIAKSPDNDGSLENALGFGIRLDQQLGEVGLKLGATMGTGSYENTDDVASPKEDISAFSIGGTISYTDISFGAGYGNNGESGCPTAETLCDAGEWWDVSAQYKFGSTTVASGYFNSTGNPGGGVSDSEIDVWTLGVNHNFAAAPGLGVHGEVTSYSIDREGADKDNEATYFMIGTKVTF